MHPSFPRWIARPCLVLGFLIGLGLAAAAEDKSKKSDLPRFSEEREVAALHFVKKHAPDLQSLLEKLKTADAGKYRQEICEIFQVTEFLCDLQSQDARRYDLELEVWKTETRALIVVAKLVNAGDEAKAKLTESLQESAKKLVDLDMQIMRLRIDELEKELGEARDELSRAEEKRETINKDRFDKLFDQAKRRKMMP